MLGSKTTFGVQAPKSPSIRVIQQPKSAQQYRFASVAARPLALAVHLAFASTVITVVGWAPAANAQQDGASAVQAQAGNVRHFDIPAGPLSKALTQFSTEAEIFLVGATDLAQSKSSPGVQGEFSVTAALSQLLAGTGLQARPNSQGQYVLQEVSGATTLPPVKVSADNLGATTEGTGSYTTGSMSSATGLNLSIRETPQTVTVVTRQKMDDFSLNDMEDVIKYTPGATYDSQGSASSFFRLRGSSISAFRVDGLLIDSNSAGGYHDDEYFSALNMSIYDRVEIVKGATGLMEGMGGFGGSVNLIRKRPTKEFQASVQSSVGRWNYYQAGIDLSGSLNESKSIRARGGVAYEDTESFMDYYQRDTTTAFGIVEADITDNTLLTLSVDYQDDNPTGTTNGVIFFPWNADGTLRNPPRSESTTTEWTENPSTQTNAMIDIQHSFNNKWVLKTAYGINKQKLGSKALTWFGNMGVGSDGTLDPAPFAYRDSGPNEVDRENYSISASGPFSALGREHTFSIGLNGSAADSVDKSYWDGSTVELTNYNDRNSIPDASSRQLAWRP